jgi:hypothetical protein
MQLRVQVRHLARAFSPLMIGRLAPGALPQARVGAGLQPAGGGNRGSFNPSWDGNCGSFDFAQDDTVLGRWLV